MNSFWSYFFGTIHSPRSTFTRLLSDSRQLLHGLKSVLLMGILYTLTTAAYAVVGAIPLISPVIGIPAEDYYFRELFFQIPVFVLGWLLASGLALLISKLFNGGGTYQSHLAALGFALNIPWYITWLVDTVIAILYILHFLTPQKWADMIARGGIWQVFTYSYPLIALIWLFLLVALALKIVEKLRWWQVIINSAVTVLCLQALMTIIIR